MAAAAAGFLALVARCGVGAGALGRQASKLAVTLEAVCVISSDDRGRCGCFHSC